MNVATQTHTPDAIRVSTLERLGVLDTPAEARFDQIVRLAAYVADTPIALLSLLDYTRQWFKARVGVEVRQTPREVAFCDHAVRSGETLWVTDATADPRFRDNPLVTGAPHVRFYCGAPVRLSCGVIVGTVCVIDRVARGYDHALVCRLEELADHAAAELDRVPGARRVREAVQAFAAACANRPQLFAADGACAPQAPYEVGRLFEERADEAEGIAEATLLDTERAVAFQIAELWRALARARKLEAVSAGRLR